MKSIKTQPSKTSNSTLELINNSKSKNWNNKRRYTSVNQFRFI